MGAAADSHALAYASRHGAYATANGSAWASDGATEAIYSRVAPDQLRKTGAPSVEQLQRSLNQRIAGAYGTYNMAPTEVQGLKKIVDTHGMPVFLKIVFPKSGDAEPETPKKQ